MSSNWFHLGALDAYTVLPEEESVRYLGLMGRVGRVLATASRYIAYASEVGEAVRPIVPQRIVTVLYGISYAYVATDVGIKSYGEFQRTDGNFNSAARKGSQAFVYQSLASIVVPSLAIHTIVHLVHKKTAKSSNRMVVRYAPTMAGLLCIPFLPFILDEPIESAVEFVFERNWPMSLKDGGSPSTA